MGNSIIFSALLVASLTTAPPPRSASPSPTTPSPSATQSPVNPLQGNWRQDDGSTTVSIAPCAGSDALCATVIAERLQPGEPSSLNTVIVRDIRPSGQSEWTGQFVIGTNQTTKVKVKLATPSRFTVRVCAMIFVCDNINMERI
jgi:uncharacterized protein (DUF2147 family)